MYKILVLLNVIFIIPIISLFYKYLKYKNQKESTSLVSICFIGLVYSFLIFVHFYYSTAIGFIHAAKIDENTSYYEVGKYMENALAEFYIFPIIYFLLFLITTIFSKVIKNRAN